MAAWTSEPNEVGWLVDSLRNIGDGRLASLALSGVLADGRLLNPALSEDGMARRWATLPLTMAWPCSLSVTACIAPAARRNFIPGRDGTAR